MCQNIAVIQSGDDSMQHLSYITIIAKTCMKIWESIFRVSQDTKEKPPKT